MLSHRSCSAIAEISILLSSITCPNTRMRIKRHMNWRAIIFALAAASATGTAFAQYPDRPLRLIVPFPPGGAVDVLGRAVALNARESIGQNIVVDNRPGFGGAVGS